jgi:hypothetical protein
VPLAAVHHHEALPPRSILKGSPARRLQLQAEAAVAAAATSGDVVTPLNLTFAVEPTPGSPPRSPRAGLASGPDKQDRRRISFADAHGHDLESVRFCDDLHYSAMSDHSQAGDWDFDDDRANCSIM